MRNKKLIVLLTVVMVLVLIVVTCSATFLVRNVNAYSYYGNAENGTVNYDARVIEAADIKKNSSMFFVDESGIKSRVESAYPNICVINVERRFPDSVTVNYVVYENLFQFAKDGNYYQCYSSGRIGSVTPQPLNNYFTLIPRGELNTGIGDYIQTNSNGYDRQILDLFVKYMHSTGLVDSQIDERIAFIDLSREGYVYIRTNAGCSIELRGGVSDFNRLLERGWSIFVDPNPESAVTTRVSGLIKVWVSGSDNKLMSTYTPNGAEIGVDDAGNKKYYSDASYYAENYR